MPPVIVSRVGGGAPLVVGGGGSGGDFSGVVGVVQHRRRERTTFTPHQVQVLKAAFAFNRYPHWQEYREIADQLKINEDTIRVWYKNYRAAVKKQEQGSATPRRRRRTVEKNEQEGASTGDDWMIRGSAKVRRRHPSGPTPTTPTLWKATPVMDNKWNAPASAFWAPPVPDTAPWMAAPLWGPASSASSLWNGASVASSSYQGVVVGSGYDPQRPLSIDAPDLWSPASNHDIRSSPSSLGVARGFYRQPPDLDWINTQNDVYPQGSGFYGAVADHGGYDAGRGGHDAGHWEYHANLAIGRQQPAGPTITDDPGVYPSPDPSPTPPTLGFHHRYDGTSAAFLHAPNLTPYLQPAHHHVESCQHPLPEVSSHSLVESPRSPSIVSCSSNSPDYQIL